jgi:hypothetical protein
MVDAYDNWREERPDDRLDRRGVRRSEPRLEQRLDQWVSAGRQLVDGVSGARPGSRGGARPGLRLDHLGRWVEDKLDWLLEDEDGWRESWEQQPAAPPQRRSQRQPLEARSRRRAAAAPSERRVADSPAVPMPAETRGGAEAWPDDDSFSVSRWQRNSGGAPGSEAPAADLRAEPSGQRGRALPRSSRRRLS